MAPWHWRLEIECSCWNMPFIRRYLQTERNCSILWKDASKADQAAEAMKITAADLLEMEVIEEIVPEPKGGAHRDYEATAAAIKDALWRHLQELTQMNSVELKDDRYRKFRKIGEFAEAQQEQIFIEEEVKSEV